MIKNIIKTLLSNVTVTIISLINSILFPLLLSIEGYAEYQTFLLYLSYLSICHLGIPSGMFIKYGGIEKKKIDRAEYKSEMYLINIILVIFTLALAVVGYLLQSQITLKIALALYPFCMIGSYKALEQAWNNFTAYAVINVVPIFVISLLAVLIYFFKGSLSVDFLIGIYISVNYLVCLTLGAGVIRFTKRIKAKKILSGQNFDVTKLGFLITFGNYINLLFLAVDKQFINYFFSSYTFAIYSFAMSTQSLMNVMISALAQPFYPKLAQKTFSPKEYKYFKEALLYFGTLAGCAYYFIYFLIENYLQSYKDSLKIVAIFFTVFPAMTIINIIYINLYKINKKVKQYIATLTGIVIVAVILNLLAYWLHGGYLGIAFATMLSYYIWLFISNRHFDEIKITIKDVIFLFGFFLIYYGCLSNIKSFLGLFIYLFLISCWGIINYWKSFQYISKFLRGHK